MAHSVCATKFESFDLTYSKWYSNLWDLVDNYGLRSVKMSGLTGLTTKRTNLPLEKWVLTFNPLIGLTPFDFLLQSVSLAGYSWWMNFPFKIGVKITWILFCNSDVTIVVVKLLCSSKAIVDRILGSRLVELIFGLPLKPSSYPFCTSNPH